MFAQDTTIMKSNRGQRSVLLVVDDNSNVAEATKHRMVHKFDSVFTATDPHKATQILEENSVSHILCGLNLGLDDSRLNGFMFSSFWKSEFPSIKRIVILTGEDICDQTIPLDIDAVIPKTTSVEALAKALLVWDGR